MALNSNIRNVPLLGNCDLTKFHADIHDYDSFEKDNSLFLNKRKVNWWTRKVGDNEFSGLRAVVNGNNFDIYKQSALLGSISRNYYKLEKVSSTAYQSASLSTCVNPYPQGDNWAFFYQRGSLKVKDVPFSATARKCGNYSIVWNGTDIKLYSSSGNWIYTFHNLKAYDTEGTAYTPDYVDFYYAETAYSESIGDLATFQVPAGHIYISLKKGKAASGYDLNPSNGALIPASITLGENVSYTDELNFYAHGAIGALYYDSHYAQHCSYTITVVNGNIWTGVYWTTGTISTIHSYKLSKNGSSITAATVASEVSVALEIKDRTISSSACTGVLSFEVDGAVTKTLTFTPDNSYQVFNYSVKYGPWAVNYINNVAQNIAHNFKKLFLLEGNEENGTLTDIDGYNNNYIYFHYAENYYRISIAQTENIWDVVKTFNGVYVLFNTTSYINALYLSSSTWFCSCDDWNDRVQWLQTTDETAELNSTSRLNDKWQNYNYLVSVSTQYWLIKRIFPVTCSQVEAYADSAVWDGSTPVYDVNCNKIDTSAWETGDSLAGYYKGTEFSSVPGSITPLYIDDDYTCPVYEDQHGVSRKQSYTVYFQTVMDIDSVQSSCKQGAINADGFTVSRDAGDIYSDPASSYQQQETPCLLDSKFIVYDSSVILITPESSFTLMRNSLVGIWVFIYLTATDTPITQGDSAFVINGVEYTYKGSSSQILDYTGQWVANTNLMSYMGFTSSRAFFYSSFDKYIYVFKGDNTFERVISLEKFQNSINSDQSLIDTLYLSSIDLFFVNLSSAVLVFYDNQYVVLETGEINNWELDYNSSCLTVNDNMYALSASALEKNNIQSYPVEPLPIEIETQYFGNTASEDNTINDCVYLVVDNLQSLTSGTVTIQAVALINNKVLESNSKSITLRSSDFNELSIAEIKYQPKFQECRGFKLKITSDFEISELKIGTSAGAMNQTVKRI